MDGDLAILFPGTEVLVSGEVFHVKPFFFGQIPKAVKLTMPVAKALNESGILLFRQDASQLGFALATDWPFKLPQIMAEGGEALMELLAFAIAKPRAWFDSVAAEEGLALTKAVFEVNTELFLKRILPMLGATPANPQTGAQSSPDSSTPSTVEPT